MVDTSIQLFLLSFTRGKTVNKVRKAINKTSLFFTVTNMQYVFIQQ